MPELNPNLIPPLQHELEEFLKSRLKGQPQAIKAIAKAYSSFQSGMRECSDRDKKRPIGVFLLLGPSGTGKTEFGRLLAQKFHDTTKAVTIIDCVSYQEKHELASLLGAPPGYLGYDDKPLLSKEKLYAKIPGYQIKSSALKSNKKEEKGEQKEKEEENIRPKAGDIFPYWINQLTLIDEGLKDIDRKFGQLRKTGLNKEGLKKKEDLFDRRKAYHLQREHIFLSFTDITLDFLKAWQTYKAALAPSASTTKKVKVQSPDTETQSLSIPVKTAKTAEEPILILIFDEIEKAHEAVKQFLLHLMEEGRVILRNGEEVELSRAFVFLTSNIGSELIGKATKGVGKIGFRPPGTGTADLEKFIKMEVKKYFKPEFLNRLDGIIVFNILTPQDFRDILEFQIKDLALLLEKFFLPLEISSQVKGFILEEAAKNPEGQARSLQDSFKKHLLQPIGNLLVTGQLTGKKKLAVSFDPEEKRVVFKS